MYELIKASANAQLRQTLNRVESRAAAFERALLLWLQRLAASVGRREIASQIRGELAKATQGELEAELRDIVTRFGLAQLTSAAQRGAVQVGQSFSLPLRLQRMLGDPTLTPAEVLASLPASLSEVERDAIREVVSRSPRPTTSEALRLIRRKLADASLGERIIQGRAAANYAASREPQIQKILEESVVAVRGFTNKVIVDALLEEPTPSAGEIARRIRFQLHGTGSGRVQETIEESGAGILPTERLTTEKGVLYKFSQARAALIARTELTIAENSGIFEGYAATGVTHLMWLAFRDGRSGDRHHEQMHRKVSPIGTPFITPLGNPLRYPGDPNAPIKDIANCRCTTRPLRRRS